MCLAMPMQGHLTTIECMTHFPHHLEVQLNGCHVLSLLAAGSSADNVKTERNVLRAAEAPAALHQAMASQPGSAALHSKVGSFFRSFVLFFETVSFWFSRASLSLGTAGVAAAGRGLCGLRLSEHAVAVQRIAGINVCLMVEGNVLFLDITRWCSPPWRGRAARRCGPARPEARSSRCWCWGGGIGCCCRWRQACVGCWTGSRDMSWEELQPAWHLHLPAVGCMIRE